MVLILRTIEGSANAPFEEKLDPYESSLLHVNIFQVLDASLRERAHGAYRGLILGSIFKLLKEEDFPC